MTTPSHRTVPDLVAYDEAVARYDPVMGLEVHVELNTASKMFCGCAAVFGAEPNTLTCPVCLGLPGALPVVNGKAVESAIRIGLALNCEIADWCRFARKNYFYPDMPKNFQTSQYDEPIAFEGYTDVDVDGETVRVEIERAHMEEDTGKSLHVGGATGRIHGASHSLVDYNRAGIPLIEIVTKPIEGTGVRAPAVAKAYVAHLRELLRGLGVSDVRMDQGSLRCDVNLSLRASADAKLGTRSETKNVNSLRSVERAIRYEVSRQAARLDAGERIVQETRHWHEDTGVTTSGREKSDAEDYRYFPEPDLVPVVVDDAWIERIRASIGELPATRRRRFEADYGLSPYDANVLVEQGQDVADYYDSVARATGEYKIASNWVQQDVLRTIKDRKQTIAGFPVGPDALADLIHRVKRGELNTNQGREVLGKMMDSGDSADAIIEAGGYKMVSDRDAIAAAVEAALAANPKAIEDLKGGKKKPEAVKGFLRGQVMKQTGGKADPALVGELLDAKLANLPG